jgi:hypothetical protein
MDRNSGPNVDGKAVSPEVKNGRAVGLGGPTAALAQVLSFMLLSAAPSTRVSSKINMPDIK